jgi:hypothetical protein
VANDDASLRIGRNLDTGSTTAFPGSSRSLYVELRKKARLV